MPFNELCARQTPRSLRAAIDLADGVCAQALVLEAIHTAAYAGQSLGSPLLCPPRKLESVDAETLLDFKAKYLSTLRTLTFPQGLHSPAGSLAALCIGSGIVRCGSSRHRCDAARMRRQVSRPVRCSYWAPSRIVIAGSGVNHDELVRPRSALCPRKQNSSAPLPS